MVVGRIAGADVILAFITSRIPKSITEAECLVEPNDPEFKTTGLKATSLICLDKLATVQRDLLRRRLGHIGRQTESAVARALRHVFEL